jgi:hypothetical protein
MRCLFGVRRWYLDATQVKFSAAEQFPFNMLSSLHADGGGNSERDRDIKALLLPFGPDHLHFDRILCLHSIRIACIIAIVKGDQVQRAEEEQ